MCPMPTIFLSYNPAVFLKHVILLEFSDAFWAEKKKKNQKYINSTQWPVPAYNVLVE